MMISPPSLVKNPGSEDEAPLPAGSFAAWVLKGWVPFKTREAKEMAEAATLSQWQKGEEVAEPACEEMQLQLLFLLVAWS